MRIIVSALTLSIGTFLFAQPPAPQPKPSTSAQPAAATSAQPPAAAIPPDKVILTIGDEKMTAAQWDDFVANLPAQYRTAAKGAGKRQVVDSLVGMKVLAQ